MQFSFIAEKKNFGQAEKYYLKSLELYPFQSSIHLKYAGFLRHVHKNVKDAEKHYKLAIETNNESSEALGSYASFLHGVLGDITSAESYYEKAVAIDDTHVNNLCNYGLFLSEEKGKFERAEELYRQALKIVPKHSNTLYNYAVMLDTHCKRKDEAEALYRRSLDIEAQHSYALYNLAVLLEEKYRRLEATTPSEREREANNKEVSALYRRATESDPHDAATAADYGRHLATVMRDPVAGEMYLTRALKLEPTSETALYNIAALQLKAGHKDEGVAGLRLLLQHHPRNLEAHQLLARTLLTPATGSSSPRPGATIKGGASTDEACGLYERLLRMAPEPTDIALEYLAVLKAHGSSKNKGRNLLSKCCRHQELSQVVQVLLSRLRFHRCNSLSIANDGSRCHRSS